MTFNDPLMQGVVFYEAHDPLPPHSCQTLDPELCMLKDRNV